MNDPEVTMPETLHSPFDLDRVALEAASAALEACRCVPARLRSLADQLSRAACSIPLNLAEGHGRAGRDRDYHYRVAYGSAGEATIAVRLLLAGGGIEDSRASEILDLLDRTRAMTWRMMHPRR